jgi:hypothetical protein
MADLRTPFHRSRIARLRRRSLAAIAAMVVAAAAIVVGLGGRGGVERGAGLVAGVAFVDSLIARTTTVERPQDVSFADAVALGYVERLRLGLGSPFRLAEYALRDPRLDSTTRRRVAAALVARTLGGRTYAIEPAALAGVGPASPPSPNDPSETPAERGGRHLALIEGAVTGSRDPRVGELAVRLAYELAVAERTVDRGAVAVVAPVAALVRDRQSAISDARRLLRAARVERADPLALLVTWRRERQFAVERPATELIAEGLQVEAMARVPALLDSVRAIASDSPSHTARPGRVDGRRPMVPLALPGAAASRLAAGSARYAAPQAPVVTAVRHHAPALLAGSGAPEGSGTRREFVDRAVNEESLAAEAARLASREGSAAAIARPVIAAAAALRTYAQEVPWFPGDPGPTNDELRREFGVSDVRFDAGVPSRWRPYYRRMLADGLRDLRRVLPALSLDGARVRFRSGPLGGATLAMHDPAARTIHLPIATSAGALAHEVAHDLDWQMGRRRYGRRGSYGTDIVVREQRGRLAASLRGLTSANLIPPTAAKGARPPDDARPAEVFARTLDWFVSVALAREGRVNGYLSAVQDEVLAGHVAVLPRDVGGWSAQALAEVLEEMTLVGAPLREWLLAQWGPARVRRPHTLAREVIATPLMRRGEPTLGGTDVWLRSEALALCATGADGAGRARAALAQLAAEARARGMLRARAQQYSNDASQAWMRSVLGVGPWSPEVGEDAVRRLAAVILSRLGQSGATTPALGWGDAPTYHGRLGRGASSVASRCGV